MYNVDVDVKESKPFIIFEVQYLVNSKKFVMKYKFEPLRIWSVKESSKFRINFNLTTHDYCNSSTGLSIFIQVTIIKNISICIKPFGELISK